jgi:hypothetical protein
MQSAKSKLQISKGDENPVEFTFFILQFSFFNEI